jgi:hypothetical protein
LPTLYIGDSDNTLYPSLASLVIYSLASSSSRIIAQLNNPGGLECAASPAIIYIIYPSCLKHSFRGSHKRRSPTPCLPKPCYTGLVKNQSDSEAERVVPETDEASHRTSDRRHRYSCRCITPKESVLYHYGVCPIPPLVLKCLLANAAPIAEGENATNDSGVILH